MFRTSAALLLSISLFFGPVTVSFAQSTAKKQLQLLYPAPWEKNSTKPFFVCLSDKIHAVAIPANSSEFSADLPSAFDYSPVEIENGSIQESQMLGSSTYFTKGELLTLSTGCKVANDYIQLGFKTVSPHAVTRGVGAFQHESLDLFGVTIRFKFPPAVIKSGDITPITSEIEKWFKSFKDQDSAIAFGNMVSGAFVKEIKIGMTLAEVENVLGPPQTKLTFPDKVVYKYKDLSIEFKNNIVTDIKY